MGMEDKRVYREQGTKETQKTKQGAQGLSAKIALE